MLIQASKYRRPTRYLGWKTKIPGIYGYESGLKDGRNMRNPLITSRFRNQTPMAGDQTA